MDTTSLVTALSGVGTSLVVVFGAIIAVVVSIYAFKIVKGLLTR